MKQTTGISNQDSVVVVTFLNLLLAEEYVLYTKIRTAHWNVNGLNNFEMHVFLENQYNALDEIIDKIAQRIRSLGHFALGSLKDFLSISQMRDNNDNLSNSEQIFEILLKDHETIIKIIQHEIYPISHQFKDIDTADFLTGIIVQQERMTRLIRSFSSHTDLITNNPIHINNNKSVNRQA